MIKIIYQTQAERDAINHALYHMGNGIVSEEQVEENLAYDALNSAQYHCIPEDIDISGMYPPASPYGDKPHGTK